MSTFRVASPASPRYDAWGRTSAFDGNNNPLGISAIGNRYGFQGREYSWKSGLYYFRASWADPVTGRWLSPDPIGISGGLNQYVFVGNNPVNFTDPLGLWTFALGGTAQGTMSASAEVSGGIAFGYSKGSGWSFGVLFSSGGGIGALPNLSAGGFVQWTSAKDVQQLKGPSGEVGISVGEALAIGADYVFGQGYQGGQVSVGAGAGVPFDLHVRGVVTGGPTWKSKKSCP